MRISEAAKQTGLTDSNIRFYEKKGLLSPDRKAESGYRDYSEEDVRRLKLILLYRKMDFPIESIAALLQGTLSVEEAFQKQEEELKTRMDVLQGSLDLCHMLCQEKNPEDIDVDYYLNYVREEEEKGRKFASVEEWLDDIADFSQITLGSNNPLFNLMVLHPKLGKLLVLVLPLWLFMVVPLTLLENYFNEKSVSPAFLVFWGILMITWLVGFIRYRAGKDIKKY